MTTKDIEDLLIEKIEALKDDDDILLFDRVDNLSTSEFEESFGDDDNAIAYVGFTEDANTGLRSRLVVEETYQVIVMTRKKGTDVSRTPHLLCEAVRDAIHGYRWDNIDIQPFEYIGRQLIDFKGETISYGVTFKTKNMLHVPVIP